MSLLKVNLDWYVNTSMEPILRHGKMSKAVFVIIYTHVKEVWVSKPSLSTV